MIMGSARRAWLAGAVAGIAGMAAAGPAQAVLEFDQNVTNEVIFGSGNDNGAFTTFRNADVGVELGLRGTLALYGVGLAGLAYFARRRRTERASESAT